MEDKGKPNWSALPYEMLLHIFSFVSIMDRMLNVSVVCSSWRLACSDAIFSRTLDISEFRRYLDSQHLVGRAQIRRIFRRGINLGRLNLTKLVFDVEFEVKDGHLIYAAQRCPNLQELWLQIPYRTTEQGLTAAFRYWRQLKCMYVSYYSRLPHVNIFKIVGENCHILTELKICACYFHEETAMVLGRHLPGLKKLSLRCATISAVGADTLLDVMVNLEELYICVRRLVYVGGPETTMLPAIMHDPRLLQKSSKLRSYIILATRENAAHVPLQPWDLHHHLSFKLLIKFLYAFSQDMNYDRSL